MRAIAAASLVTEGFSPRNCPSSPKASALLQSGHSLDLQGDDAPLEIRTGASGVVVKEKREDKAPMSSEDSNTDEVNSSDKTDNKTNEADNKSNGNAAGNTEDAAALAFARKLVSIEAMAPGEVTASPTPALNVTTASPTPALNVTDTTASPTPALNLTTASPTPALNVTTASPTPALNVTDTTASPTPALNATDTPEPDSGGFWDSIAGSIGFGNDNAEASSANINGTAGNEDTNSTNAANESTTKLAALALRHGLVSVVELTGEEFHNDAGDTEEDAEVDEMGSDDDIDDDDSGDVSARNASSNATVAQNASGTNASKAPAEDTAGNNTAGDIEEEADVDEMGSDDDIDDDDSGGVGAQNGSSNATVAQNASGSNASKAPAEDEASDAAGSNATTDGNGSKPQGIVGKLASILR